MTLAVRRMVAGDIEAVLALAETTPEAPHWNRSDYESCLAADETAPLRRAGFIAEAEGRLLGFSIGKLVAGVCELESIAVAREARGQGMGRALLAVVAKWAQVHGAVRIELEVRASNARAIKLYEQAGMRREGFRPAYYLAPEEDALLMGAALLHGGKLA